MIGKALSGELSCSCDRSCYDMTLSTEQLQCHVINLLLSCGVCLHMTIHCEYVSAEKALSLCSLNVQNRDSNKNIHLLFVLLLK